MDAAGVAGTLRSLGQSSLRAKESWYAEAAEFVEAQQAEVERLTAKVDLLQRQVEAGDRAMATINNEAGKILAQRDAYAREALVALAGAHVPTPEKGYVKDGGPGQLVGDIRALACERDRLRAALAAVRELAEHGWPFGRFEVAVVARAALSEGGKTP